MSNTFAIKSVLDYTVEEYSATGRGNLLFMVDYAGSSNVSTTSERLPIRGGSGNYKILDIDHTKDCMFNSVLPILDISALATKLGGSVTKAATTTPRTERLTATTGATPTITLASTPLAGTLKIHELLLERDFGTEQTAGTPATANQYSITGRVVTLHSTMSGKRFVASSEYTSGVNAQNIKITAEDFPKFITITGRGLVDDDQENLVIPVTFKIHKAKVKPDFELTMQAGTATELPFDCDCYTILNSANKREFVNIVKLNDEV